MTGASALAVDEIRDVHEFERSAGPFLTALEAENNLVLGLITGLKGGRTFGPEPPLFAVVRDRDRVVGAALRTPPHNLLLTEGTSGEAVDAIVDAFLRAMPDTPGIAGPNALVARAVERWSAATGRRAQRRMASRIYRLTRVIAPQKPASGTPRKATDRDRDVLVDWFHAFAIEALSSFDTTRATAGITADHWLRGGLWIWDDGGPVCMAGVGGATPHGIRVSAVYTPPDKRRRGYATSLVATISQMQLDAGRTFCFLYTDLANPTSNKIYMDIGYEAVSDSEQYEFV